MALSPQEIDALILSLKVGLWVILWGLPLATITAWVLARHDFYGKTIIDGLIHAPLVLPPVIIGYLLLITFGPDATMGAWLNDVLGISFAFNWKGAALAAGIMAFPLTVRAIRLSIEATDGRLEQVARTLGAGPVHSAMTITLPLALPGVIMGGLLGFARALGEFGATIAFVASIPGLTQTLPLALYDAIQTPGGEDAAFRLMAISLVIALGALAASEWLARLVRRRMEGGK